jgi:hypothetical protein
MSSAASLVVVLEKHEQPPAPASDFTNKLLISFLTALKKNPVFA